MVVFDCEGTGWDQNFTQRNSYGANVMNFVNRGGRMFGSHWSYSWIDGNGTQTYTAATALTTGLGNAGTGPSTTRATPPVRCHRPRPAPGEPAHPGLHGLDGRSRHHQPPNYTFAIFRSREARTSRSRPDRGVRTARTATCGRSRSRYHAVRRACGCRVRPGCVQRVPRRDGRDGSGLPEPLHGRPHRAGEGPALALRPRACRRRSRSAELLVPAAPAWNAADGCGGTQYCGCAQGQACINGTCQNQGCVRTTCAAEGIICRPSPTAAAARSPVAVPSARLSRRRRPRGQDVRLRPRTVARRHNCGGACGPSCTPANALSLGPELASSDGCSGTINRGCTPPAVRRRGPGESLRRLYVRSAHLRRSGRGVRHGRRRLWRFRRLRRVPAGTGLHRVRRPAEPLCVAASR